MTTLKRLTHFAMTMIKDIDYPIELDFTVVDADKPKIVQKRYSENGISLMTRGEFSYQELYLTRSGKFLLVSRKPVNGPQDGVISFVSDEPKLVSLNHASQFVGEDLRLLESRLNSLLEGRIGSAKERLNRLKYKKRLLERNEYGTSTRTSH